MPRYLIGRIGQAVLVLWAAFTVAFVLLQALPGDAILIKFQSPDLGLSAEQIADIRALLRRGRAASGCSTCTASAIS